MIRVGFESTIPVSERREKEFRALDRTATVIGSGGLMV
jgi:hypothetical protein